MKNVIHPDYKKIADYIVSIPSRFQKKEGEMIHDGRNKVMAFEHEGIRMVVKRFKDVNPVQRVVYTFFRKTKAERAYLYAEKLRTRGIDTPHEIAFLEKKKGFLFITGYFVCLSCENPPVFPALASSAEFDREIATDLVAFIVEMHRKGILFGDLNFGNFLYKKGEDGHYHFTVIDTNRSHFLDTAPSREECLKNLRTMTHHRNLFRFMLREYARLQGWNEGETVREAFRYLFLFEKEHDRKRQWQNKMKIKRQI